MSYFFNIFFFCLDTKEAKSQDLKFFPRKSYGNKPLARSKPAGQLWFSFY